MQSIQCDMCKKFAAHDIAIGAYAGNWAKVKFERERAGLVQLDLCESCVDELREFVKGR